MTRQTKASLRASTPPAVNTMSVSEFVRGGINRIQTPTVVVSHGEEVGTWYPRGQGVTAMYYNSTNTAMTPDNMSTTTMGNMLAAAGAPGNQSLDVAGFNETLRQMREYLSAAPKTQEEEETDA